MIAALSRKARPSKRGRPAGDSVRGVLREPGREPRIGLEALRLRPSQRKEHVDHDAGLLDADGQIGAVERSERITRDHRRLGRG